MRRLLLATMFGAIALALPAIAADAPAKAATTKPATTVNRMDLAKGSFHKKHAQKLKLACETCHDPKVTDVLVVRQASAGSPGPINREVCLGCHQSPAKPTWYGAVK